MWVWKVLSMHIQWNVEYNRIKIGLNFHCSGKCYKNETFFADFNLHILCTHLINLIDKSYTFSSFAYVGMLLKLWFIHAWFGSAILLDAKIYDQFKLIHEPMCGCCLFVRIFQKLFFRVLNYTCGAHQAYKITVFWHNFLVKSNLVCKCIISSYCFFFFSFIEICEWSAKTVVSHFSVQSLYC